MNLPPGSPERAAVPVSAARFPYVNGGLFQGVHTVPRFSSRSRKALIDAGNLDWSDINTDIFGMEVSFFGRVGVHSNSRLYIGFQFQSFLDNQVSVRTDK